MLAAWQVRLAGAAIAAALLAAAFGWHKVVVHDRDRWRQAATTAQAALTAEQGAFRAATQNRAAEFTADKAAAAGAATACDARVAQARASAGAIKTLVEKTDATDPKTGCPVPGLYGADELQRAIAPPR
jgi:hypothetical protein